MARQRFGPQHSITGDAVFVPEGDGAWDKARIGREFAEARAAEIDRRQEEQGEEYEAPKWADRGEGPPLLGDTDDPASRHPFVRYQRGETRFDLTAEGILDYLDSSKNPERYQLQRLSWSARSQVHRLQVERRLGDAQALAFLEGLVGCENVDRRLERLLAARKSGDKQATDEKLIDAAATVAYEVIGDVGSAVILLSRDLTEEEKKV